MKTQIKIAIGNLNKYFISDLPVDIRINVPGQISCCPIIVIFNQSYFTH